MSSVIANLIILRRRVSTWILMGVWVLLGLTFAYLLPYLTFRGADSSAAQAALTTLLPENLIGSVLGGFPVFGGVIALMLGVLAIGSDYGWDTLKTTLSQRSGRLRLLTSKITAVGLGLLVYMLAIFMTGAIASYTIATLEGATTSWPSALDLLQAFGAGWFLLVIWAFVGLALAVLSRGTALAIGLGVLYTLLIESLLTALAGQVSWIRGARSTRCGPTRIRSSPRSVFRRRHSPIMAQEPSSGPSSIPVRRSWCSVSMQVSSSSSPRSPSSDETLPERQEVPPGRPDLVQREAWSVGSAATRPLW